jgi:histidinol dehydrogenase
MKISWFKPKSRSIIEYLKKASPTASSVTQEIRDTVSKVILEIERDGMGAVRRYSSAFDNWNPESFFLTDAQIKSGLEQLRCAQYQFVFQSLLSSVQRQIRQRSRYEHSDLDCYRPGRRRFHDGRNHESHSTKRKTREANALGE